MFLVVNRRARTIAALIALATAVSASPALARGTSRGPTRAQIRAAVRRAEHSKSLWATVNICNTTRHPKTIGVRGQMPSLGFAATMSMRVQVDYWTGTQFALDPGVSKRVALGDPTNRIIQGGANFTFQPPVILSGTITFEWKLAGKVIGHTTRLTGHGYRHVDGGDPPGYSAATCRMS
jgi:hypothetical protein